MAKRSKKSNDQRADSYLIFIWYVYAEHFSVWKERSYSLKFTTGLLDYMQLQNICFWDELFLFYN